MPGQKHANFRPIVAVSLMMQHGSRAQFSEHVRQPKHTLSSNEVLESSSSDSR